MVERRAGLTEGTTEMSSKFVIEMPANRVSKKQIGLFCGISIVVGISTATLLGMVSDSKTSVLTVAIMLVVFAALAVCGTLSAYREVKHYRYRRAERHLKKGIDRLGYIALEPIEVTGKRARVLLKDGNGPALWNVSVNHNKVTCAKSPQMQ